MKDKMKEENIIERRARTEWNRNNSAEGSFDYVKPCIFLNRIE